MTLPGKAAGAARAGRRQDDERLAAAHVVLAVESVSKTFSRTALRDKLARRAGRPIRALRGVTFEVRAGEVVGLLGPNGAGKTTLLRIACDLVHADAGRVRIEGEDVGSPDRRVLSKIGLVTTNERSFHWRLSGRDNLLFYAALQRIGRDDARRRADEMLRTFDLGSHADRRFLTYSSGMKKKLALCRALMHDPRLLLLDEATSSLDPAAADGYREHVRELARSGGRAVLWATHLESEIESMCDRVVVLVDGEVRCAEDAAAFAARREASLAWSIEIGRQPLDPEACGVLARWGGRAEATPDGIRIDFPAAAGSAGRADVLRALLDGGAHVRRLEPKAASLGEIFTALGSPARPSTAVTGEELKTRA
jgi:ABC-2 type transport system ATP-binding protein